MTRPRQKSLLKAYGLHKHLEIHRVAQQRKGEMETDGNITFYMSDCLCLTSKSVKPRLASKTRKDAPLPMADCLHPSSHSSSSTPAPLGEQGPPVLPLHWRDTSMLTCSEDGCHVCLHSASHTSGHIIFLTAFVVPPLLF